MAVDTEGVLAMFVADDAIKRQLESAVAELQSSKKARRQAAATGGAQGSAGGSSPSTTILNADAPAFGPAAAALALRHAAWDDKERMTLALATARQAVGAEGTVPRS